MERKEFQASGRDELVQQILPFWRRYLSQSADLGEAQYAGAMLSDGTLDTAADRSAVFLCRLLWGFSVCARMLGDESCFAHAHRLFGFIEKHLIDTQYSGVWRYLAVTNQPATDFNKDIVSQAYAIYALAEYAEISGESRAETLALAIFNRVENNAKCASGGYSDRLDRAWNTLHDPVSAAGPDISCREHIDTRTQLHLLEAYTTLFRVTGSVSVKFALRNLCHIFVDKILIKPFDHLVLAFDENWQPISDEISYGHNVESLWLVYHACDLLGEKRLMAKAKAAVLRLCDATLFCCCNTMGALPIGVDDRGGQLSEMSWWAQAEAINCLLCAHELSNDERYWQLGQKFWLLIHDKFKDLALGEWYSLLNADGTPNRQELKVGPWRGSYHSMRVCLNVAGLLYAQKQQPLMKNTIKR